MTSVVNSRYPTPNSYINTIRCFDEEDSETYENLSTSRMGNTIWMISCLFSTPWHIPRGGIGMVASMFRTNVPADYSLKHRCVDMVKNIAGIVLRPLVSLIAAIVCACGIICPNKAIAGLVIAMFKFERQYLMSQQFECSGDDQNVFGHRYQSIAYSDYVY